MSKPTDLRRLGTILLLGVIAGLTFKSTAQGFIRVPADFVISHDEVRKMIQELQAQRQGGAPAKRGWRG